MSSANCHLLQIMHDFEVCEVFLWLQQPDQLQCLGDVSGAISDFPDIEFPEGFALPEDCMMEDVDTFRSIYVKHCEVIWFWLMLPNISVQKFLSALMGLFIQ
jgi:hypothetical protein